MKNPIEHITHSNWFVKLFNWEFWNFYVVYFPYIIYYIWLSMRARSFFWFSTSNPGIENAGFIGESKNEIFKKIPQKYLPLFIKISHQEAFSDIINLPFSNQIKYPFIAKPDVGERGQGVSKIHSLEEWQAYHLNMKVDYIVQEFIPYDLELGVFYYKLPQEAVGKVSSIVKKAFLQVTGNGHSSLGELVEAYPRARFRKDYLIKKFAKQWNTVIAKEMSVELEGIGNHVRGTTFLNANHLITGEVIQKFDEISKQIEGFYFGRFDIRCKSEQDFLAGENIKILELNGAGAEPAHIYQPGFSFWKGQRVLLSHLKVLYQISTFNHKNGHAYMTWKEAKLELEKHKIAIQKLQHI